MIAPQIKKQKKTSKYRFINWLYKKIYGYNYESTIDSDVLVSDNFIIFKDKETYNKLKKAKIKS